MSENFTIERMDYKTIGREQRSIPVQVVGFWSRDPISIYCQRGWSEEVKWKFSLSVSSGGRDTKVVESDADAYINYGEAIVAAAMLIKDLEANVDQIEAGYQEYRAELAAAAERERAAKQALIDADPEMGTGKATRIIKQVILDLEDPARGRELAIQAYRRGTDVRNIIYVRKYTKLVCEFAGKRISKQEAIEILSQCSAREVE